MLVGVGMDRPLANVLDVYIVEIAAEHVMDLSGQCHLRLDKSAL